MRSLPLAAALLASAAIASACTITSMGPEHGPPRVESDGLLEGHAAFGFREEDRFLRLHVLEGESDGAVAELVVWKLFRLEVGALGAGIGIGPFDLALGTLFYEPDVPAMEGQEPPPPPWDGETCEPECEICAEAAAREQSE